MLMGQEVRSGVAQGSSALGFGLLKIFVSDLIKSIDSKLIQFADDTKPKGKVTY